MVRIIIALTIWSFYVVVGRVCAPAIQGRSSQGYSVGTGGMYSPSPGRTGLIDSRHHDWVHLPLAHVYLELLKGRLGKTVY